MMLKGSLLHSLKLVYFKLNSSKLLWLSLLPAKIKKIQSKMNELEWSQQYSLNFKMLKGS